MDALFRVGVLALGAVLLAACAATVTPPTPTSEFTQRPPAASPTTGQTPASTPAPTRTAQSARPTSAPTTTGVRKNPRSGDTKGFYFAPLIPFDGIAPVYDPKFADAARAFARR
jgi:hypothetical protein